MDALLTYNTLADQDDLAEILSEFEGCLMAEH